jgi:hypothetical protein
MISVNLTFMFPDKTNRTLLFLTKTFFLIKYIRNIFQNVENIFIEIF